MTPQMLEHLRVGIVGLQDWAWEIIEATTPQGYIQHIAKLINCRCNQFIEIFDEMKTPKTNADRIRSMTDEELASRLCRMNGKQCPPNVWCRHDIMSCEVCWINWLKEKVQDD